jgi:hypothetical protein
LAQASNLFASVPSWLVVTMKRHPSRDDGQAKRARQLGLASLLEEGLPITRLVRVVEKLKSHADLLAKPPSRKEFRNLQDRMFEQLGEMESIDLGGGETWDWEFFSFGKVLNELAATSPDFAGTLQDLLLQCPPTFDRPWNLIVYWDETVPGDPLRLDNLRKFEAVYITIREFGPTLLKHERMWLPVAAVRTKMVDKVPGRWTELLKVLLRRLLVGTNGVFGMFQLCLPTSFSKWETFSRTATVSERVLVLWVLLQLFHVLIAGTYATTVTYRWFHRAVTKSLTSPART